MEKTGGITINTIFYNHGQYFDVCEINGSKFAFFSKHIYSNEHLNIDLKDHNIVFLAPVEAEKNISINAISVIALSSFQTKNGGTEIHGSGKLFMLGSSIISKLDNKLIFKNDTLSVPVITERKEMIIDEFQKGISNKHGLTIVDALVETFDALVDPYGENRENSNIDIAEAFKFFDISAN